MTATDLHICSRHLYFLWWATVTNRDQTVSHALVQSAVLSTSRSSRKSPASTLQRRGQQLPAAAAIALLTPHSGSINLLVGCAAAWSMSFTMHSMYLLNDECTKL